MPTQSLSTIKNWFLTGKKPTQNQFHDTWESFRHKAEAVPMAEIAGLNDALAATASSAALNNHINDSMAHAALFDSCVRKTGNEAIQGDKTFEGNTTFNGSVYKNNLPLATEAYVNSVVTGLWDDRGNYDASVNTFPSAGGSGASGAVVKGDIWTVLIGGTLGGVAVLPGDTVRALIDGPGQTAANWAIAENNLGYVPLNKAGDAMSGSLNMANNSIINASMPGVKISTVYDLSGGQQLQFVGTSNPVNYFTMANSATLADLQLAAAGQDLDISVKVISKGTGTVKANQYSFPINSDGFLRTFGGAITAGRTYTLPDKAITFAGINNETFTGTTTFTHLRVYNSTSQIQDANGAPYIIFGSTVLNAVNYIRVSNSAQGASVGLAVEGSDLHIPLVITTKGTGAFGISVNGGTRFYVNNSVAEFSVPMKTTNATVSSSTTTGALIVAGGAGIAGAVNIGGDLNVTGYMFLKSYTVSTVPSAASKAGALIYVTNEVGGPVPVFSDGTSWRRVTDRAVITA